MNIALTIVSASSRRSIRSRIGGKSNPRPMCSASNQAAPRPKIARPPEITSSVVTVFASSAGLR